MAMLHGLRVEWTAVADTQKRRLVVTVERNSMSMSKNKDEVEWAGYDSCCGGKG